MAFFGVNFILQKFCPCKKNDKYKVCARKKTFFFNWCLPLGEWFVGRFVARIVLCLTLTSCSDCLCKLFKGWEPARRFSLLFFLHISVLTMSMMENLGREWCAWCLGRPQGFGCSGGARRRSWCSRSTPRQASSRTIWVLDWFSSLLVTYYGLLVIRQCERIVIFSLHMMIETHLTAHSGIYMTAGKSYFSLSSTLFFSPQKDNPIKPSISISDSAPLNPPGPL